MSDTTDCGCMWCKDATAKAFSDPEGIPGVLLTRQQRQEALMTFAGALYEASRVLYHTYQFDTGQDLQVTLQPWAELSRHRQMVWLFDAVEHARTPLVKGLFLVADGVE